MNLAEDSVDFRDFIYKSDTKCHKCHKKIDAKGKYVYPQTFMNSKSELLCLKCYCKRNDMSNWVDLQYII
jgi:hypothetical protein